jgi:hypothetical protein
MVKAFGTGGKRVETRNRLSDILYEEDSIVTMDKIAETTKAKFERHGIATVLDTKMISAATISAIKGDTYFRVSEKAIKKWAAAAENAHEGSASSRVHVDHRRETNPYLSRYGSDYWMDEILKCSAMSGFICTTKMVSHMKKETDIVMEGTSYDGKGQFYHDAMTLVICNKTKQYMQDNDLLKYWLLLLEGLQAGTRYHNFIPGDNPELMPTDKTLNMNIHSSARYHVAITAHLAKNDPKKFTFSTPKEVSSAYLRLVDNVISNALLIPQVRPAHKYPNPPWEMIHPPGGDNAVCM